MQSFCVAIVTINAAENTNPRRKSMSAASVTTETFFPMAALVAAPTTTWMAALTANRRGLALYDLHEWETTSGDERAELDKYGFVPANRELFFIREPLKPHVEALRQDGRFKVFVNEFEHSAVHCMLIIVNRHWNPPART